MAQEMSTTRFQIFIETSIKFYTWDTILEEAGIVNVADKGEQYEITCPFHEDKRPSCRLTKATGQYHCFSCERHGTYTRFLWELQGQPTTYSRFCEQILRSRPDIQSACGFNTLFITEKTLDPAFEQRRVFTSALATSAGMSLTTLHSRIKSMGDNWENMVASLTLLQQGVSPEGVFATMKKREIKVAVPVERVGLADLFDE